MVALITEFDKALAMSFASGRELILRVKDTKPHESAVTGESARCDDDTQSVYGREGPVTVPNPILGEPSQPVPVNYMPSNKPLGKRKVPKKEKGGECYYYDGRYN
ncbi:hypothetical protein GN244_ATG13777 [Phytophthora infestans]|uniref:Uncharacterized protein n=1 Tax=Phytophthora infestans TaxID=4787 RepID=A0A833S6B5_PHYIN|nr:hypothetical protein GN244_ATG13777 [Phytophthora infestans]